MAKKRKAASKEKVVYIRDPWEYSVPHVRDQLPPHVELTPAAIRAWYNKPVK
jgi:hypothetical protein